MHDPCGGLWLLVASQYLSYALLPVDFCCLSTEASLPRISVDCPEALEVSITATTEGARTLNYWVCPRASIVEQCILCYVMHK